MDSSPSSPLPCTRSKPASDLAPPPSPVSIAVTDDDDDHHRQSSDQQLMAFTITATPPSRKKAAVSNSSPVRLRDLLVLSPSPRRKAKSRHAVIVDERCLDGGTPPRKKGKKSRAPAAAAVVAASVDGLMGCAVSPRNVRRTRRRLEKEIPREEKEMVVISTAEGNLGRVRKRKQSRHKVVVVTREDQLSLVPSVPSPSNPSPASVTGVFQVLNRASCSYGSNSTYHC